MWRDVAGVQFDEYIGRGREYLNYIYTRTLRMHCWRGRAEPLIHVWSKKPCLQTPSLLSRDALPLVARIADMVPPAPLCKGLHMYMYNLLHTLLIVVRSLMGATPSYNLLSTFDLALISVHLTLCTFYALSTSCHRATMGTSRHNPSFRIFISPFSFVRSALSHIGPS